MKWSEEDMPCDRCYFNRPMERWGQEFNACFYNQETKKDLYETYEQPCTGFQENNIQLELII